MNRGQSKGQSCGMGWSMPVALDRRTQCKHNSEENREDRISFEHGEM